MRISALFAVLILGAGVWWYVRSAQHPLPLQGGDSVASWDITGSHKDGAELEAKVRKEIERLQGLLGSPENEPTDYILYISLANQYELIGDGKKAYEYLGKAMQEDPKTGLAWHNAGSLLSRLGAMQTARVAYGRAVEVQPHIEQYHRAYAEFLIQYFPDDAATIDAVLKKMEDQFKEDTGMLQLRASWYTKVGRIQDAIDAWRSLEKEIGVRDPAIEAEIARLEARL